MKNGLLSDILGTLSQNRNKTIEIDEYFVVKKKFYFIYGTEFRLSIFV